MEARGKYLREAQRSRRLSREKEQVGGGVVLKPKGTSRDLRGEGGQVGCRPSNQVLGFHLPKDLEILGVGNQRAGVP